MKKLLSAIGLLATISMAEACQSDQIDLGVLAGSTHMDLIGSYARAGAGYVLGSGAYLDTGGIISSQEKFTNVPQGSPIRMDYQFSFAQSYRPNRDPLFSMDLSGWGTSHDSIDLLDLRTGQTWLAKETNGQLDLIANIPKSDLRDKFSIQVELNGNLGQSGGFEATGNVPVPGSLILFSSALLGLGIFSYRKKSLTRA